MFVKICGISDAETARVAIEAGADAVGLIMSEPSPRNVSIDAAQAVVDAAAGRALSVLVVREMPVTQAIDIATQLGVDVLQLHGSYGPADFTRATTKFPRVWRAGSLLTSPNIRAGEYGEELLLLDGARAGSGEVWDLSRINRDQLGERWLLAGGLSPTNVAKAIRTAQPWGVDVSSGVERAPGVKDHEKIIDFIQQARDFAL